MYFSATIFSLVGFRSPTLTSLSIATTNFLLTLVAFHYIDRVGRRRILLLSIPIMIVGLLMCAAAFNYLDVPMESNGVDAHANAQDKTWPLVLLVAMIVYVAGYAIGLGNVPWQQSEYVFISSCHHLSFILVSSLPFYFYLYFLFFAHSHLRLFPLSVRSLGSGLAAATNWGSNTLIGLTFLPMMQFFTPTWTFVLYALVCVGVWVAVQRIYPETAGLGLEDVGELLRHGWGVEESIEQAKGRKRRRGD